MTDNIIFSLDDATEKRLMNNKPNNSNNNNNKPRQPRIKATTSEDLSWLDSTGGGGDVPTTTILSLRPPPCFTTKRIVDPAPLSPSERFEQWKYSLNVSITTTSAEAPQATTQECPTLLRELVSSAYSDATTTSSSDHNTIETATVAATIQRMHELWGAFPPLAFDQSHASCGSPRTQALFRCLMAFHDPLLVVFFESNNVQAWFRQVKLFGMYVQVPRLLDLAVLCGVSGFDTPQLGSFYFALGLLISNRTQLMAIAPATDASVEECISRLLEQATTSTAGGGDGDSIVELAIAVGSRAAASTPAYFSRLLGEVEMTTLEDYSQRAADYMQLQIQARRRRAAASTTTTTTTTTSAAGTPSDSTQQQTWWNKVVNNLVPTTAPPSTNTTSAPNPPPPETPVLSQLLKRTIPSATATTPSAKKNAQRRLYLCEFKGKRKLGLKLVAGSDGLTVKGFDRNDGTMGEAEEDGTVQLGDLMHAVNGVSVVLLTSKMASKVIQAQERPLHIVFSTVVSNTDATRILPPKLSDELVKEQKAILYSRLYSFYGRQGGGDKQNRVDDLLPLFAGNEVGFLRALACKYGEKVPGDATFTPVLVTSDPKEIVESLLRVADNSTSLNVDAVFVDARPQSERIDTGTFEANFFIGPDELAEDNSAKHLDVLTTHISQLKSKHTKIHLIPSGKARLSWMTEPTKARAEQATEDAFLLQLASLLWSRGVFHVDVIQGGFVSVFREIHMRRLSGIQLDGCTNGRIRRGSEALAKVDFEDAKSVTTFIVAYFNDFVEGSATASSSATTTTANNRPTTNNNNNNLATSAMLGGAGLVALASVAKHATTTSIGNGGPPPPPPHAVTKKDSASSVRSYRSTPQPPAPAKSPSPPPLPSPVVVADDDDAFAIE